MSDETQALIFQPECDKTEIWRSGDTIMIRQEVPLLQETNTVAINVAFLRHMMDAIVELTKGA